MEFGKERIFGQLLFQIVHPNVSSLSPQPVCSHSLEGSLDHHPAGIKQNKATRIHKFSMNSHKSQLCTQFDINLEANRSIPFDSYRSNRINMNNYIKSCQITQFKIW